jgi:catechol 2,3-dioxygenase-like lactoylglutathione lyase family enzyme
MTRRFFCTLLLAGGLLLAGPHPLVKGVDSIGLTVSDLDRSVEFYSTVLNFQKVSETEVDGENYEHLTGVFGIRMRTARMRLGEEYIELTEFLAPRGRPAPVDARSNDRWFQHIAIIVSVMDRAYQWLREHKVQHASPAPQLLPAWNKNAGGIRAFYFRDPDGHPLEVIVVSSRQRQSKVARCERQAVSGNRSHRYRHFGDRGKFEVLSGQTRNGSCRGK